MKFSCNKRELNETINNILPAVGIKSNLLALEGILMNCKNNLLTLTAYNLELGIVKSIEVTNCEEGILVLNASLLSNIISKMPDGEVSFSTDDKLLTVIKCGDVDFTILGLSPDDYPDMPTISNENEFSLPQELLRSMIAQTIFSISQSDQNPILTGSLFDIKEGILKIVSVDGVRLALRQEKINVDKEINFIVPGKSLSELLKLLSRFSASSLLKEKNEKNAATSSKETGEDTEVEKENKVEKVEKEDKVKINIGEKHIGFILNGYTIISRLLEGTFLDYESAIPKEKSTSVFVETKPLLDSVNRVSIIITDKTKSPIRCIIEEGEIKFFCETSVGKVNDSIDAKIEGEDVTIGFNNKYMADALRACECENLRILLNGPISPIVILPPDSDDFLFLVLPVRLKN